MEDTIKDLAEEVPSFSWKLQLWYIQFLIVTVLQKLQKTSERKEIPTVELPVTNDSSAEKGRTRARARGVCAQTCLAPFFFPLWLECVLMGNAHLTILTFPFVISFKNACLKPVACLEVCCCFPTRMDMNFPGGYDGRVQHLCPTGPGSSARVPIPPPALGQRAGPPQAFGRGSGQALRKQKPFSFHSPCPCGK